jgi:hypothetical protein
VGRHPIYVYSSVSRYPKVVAATYVEAFVTRFNSTLCYILENNYLNPVFGSARCCEMYACALMFFLASSDRRH